MTRLKRLSKIAYIAGKYRLDKLLDKKRLPLSVRLLLAPAIIFGSASAPRGARLRMALEELGPIFIKFGQLLSTPTRYSACGYLREIAQLQDNVPPFAPELFKANVESALEAKVEDVFAKFESEPLASASIAQVHPATLTDGKRGGC